MLSIAPVSNALVNRDSSSSSQASSSKQSLTPLELVSANLERIGAISPRLLFESVEAEERDINYELLGSRSIEEWAYSARKHKDAEGDMEVDDESPVAGIASQPNATSSLPATSPEAQRNPTQLSKSVGKRAARPGVITTSDQSALSRIQDYLKTHRGNAFKLKFFYFNADDKKTDCQFGAVIKIQLSARSFRVYSTQPTFSNAVEAENDCGRLAIYEGALQYIETESKPSEAYFPNDDLVPVDFLTFYNALPRPFPVEKFNKMTDLQAQSYSHQWFNSLEGLANTNQIEFSSKIFHIREGGCFGSVLRLELSSDSGLKLCKTYLVEPLFKKQNLAKAAVKIQAMTEGCKQLVEDFLDTSSAATYPTVSPAMIEFVNKQFWPQMLAKCNAIRRHYTPWFDYTNDSNCWGCKTRLVIPPEASHSGTSIVREYTVPPIYHSKVQARIAVCCIAAEDGILEFLERRGLTSGSHSPLALRAAELLGRKKKQQSDGDRGSGATSAAGLTSGDAAKLNDEVEEGELREDDDMSSGSLSSHRPESMHPHSSSHTHSQSHRPQHPSLGSHPSQTGSSDTGGGGSKRSRDDTITSEGSTKKRRKV
ncbi:hypothetical protein K435DRAFT_325812 [Dendrothele bispora CBS 962.96]|uniref:Uncharacterized protein n=1 Tax=Dendrothele bispora (strain CBS 962.96) TaxID=1314807 RepID=A0A4S8LGJ4_DENBC|nr:hypothetical protein K435DRAFT_325812 [Dendrothele bispora CBS 962.96]